MLPYATLVIQLYYIMDLNKYSDFFYITKSGYHSYFRNELAQVLILDFSKKYKGRVYFNESDKIKYLQSYLNEILALLKFNKIPNYRCNKFIQFIINDLILALNSSLDFEKSLSNLDKLNPYNTERYNYTKDYDNIITNPSKWNFEEINNIVKKSKVSIYMMYLGISPKDKLTKELVQSKYRRLVRIKHPDVGGSQEEFMAIQEAKEYLETYLNFESKVY